MEGQPSSPAPPDHPSLHMCVIVDARIGSRKEILKDLKATNLFENLVEAMSLDDGLDVTRKNAVDACLIGPAVSPPKAALFMHQVSHTETSKNCAFIAIADTNSPHRAELEEAGAHAVLERPYTKQVFAELIIQCVVKANSSSRFSGTLVSGTKTEPAQEQQRSLGTSLLKAMPQMKSLIAAVDADELALVEGKPCEKAAEALDNIVNTILAESGPAYETEKFRNYFEAALLTWYIALHESGSKAATTELRNKLADYSEDP